MSQDVVTGFRSIIDFRRRRSKFAVFCFYLVYMFIGFILACMAEGFISHHFVAFVPGKDGIVAGPPHASGDDFATFTILIPWVSAVYCTGFHIFLLVLKKAWKDPLHCLILLGTVFLSMIGMVVLGFILPAMELNWNLKSPERKSV